MILRKTLVNTQPAVGELIKEIRTLTCLTQEQLASVLGVTYSTVNRWENGRGKPSLMGLKRIEEILQTMGSQGMDLLQKYLTK